MCWQRFTAMLAAFWGWSCSFELNANTASKHAHADNTSISILTVCLCQLQFSVLACYIYYFTSTNHEGQLRLMLTRFSRICLWKISAVSKAFTDNILSNWGNRFKRVMFVHIFPSLMLPYIPSVQSNRWIISLCQTNVALFRLCVTVAKKSW